MSAAQELDLTDPFEKVLNEMLALSRRKRHDYAQDDDPWSNFRRSADQVGAQPELAVEVLIATKQARLRELRSKEAVNESVRDTMIDRAVYSVIALVLFDEEAV